MGDGGGEAGFGFWNPMGDRSLLFLVSFISEKSSSGISSRNRLAGLYWVVP